MLELVAHVEAVALVEEVVVRKHVPLVELDDLRVALHDFVVHLDHLSIDLPIHSSVNKMSGGRNVRGCRFPIG